MRKKGEDCAHRPHSMLLAVALLALFCRPCLSQHGDYDDSYDYGDVNYGYDGLTNGNSEKALQSENHTKLQSREAHPNDPGGPELPLCCPVGQVFNHDVVNCSLPAPDWPWRPMLSGEPSARFFYAGFPRCPGYKNPFDMYQKDIIFQDRQAILPRYVQLESVPLNQYCVVKVFDPSDQHMCEPFLTKVFVCTREKAPVSNGTYWGGVVVSHVLILLTLLAFFFVKEIRCLQGQYLICFFTSLLIYNICLVPVSGAKLDISFVSCISIGAIKYFFFCGVFLWFNVICFDVWRTLRRRVDISSRRRFVCYSLYTWLISAILTTFVLVMPYTEGRSYDRTLMRPTKDYCELRTDINIILQLAQTFVLLVNLLFLALATFSCSTYTKYGNGLSRSDAIFCLKQAWKLFIIMLCHTIMGVPYNLLNIEIVDLWRYVLVESIALFGVFAYRQTVLKAIYRSLCRTRCYHPNEEAEHDLKDQQTWIQKAGSEQGLHSFTFSSSDCGETEESPY